MKKLATMKTLLILGVAAAGLMLFAASPASAQSVPTIKANPQFVPAEVGTHNVTINGTGWAGAPQGLTVTACHGIEGGDPENLPTSLAALRQACSTLADDGDRGNPAGDGTWSYDLVVNVTQQDIENESIVILAGELREGSQWTAFYSLGVGDQREVAPGSMADPGSAQAGPAISVNPGFVPAEVGTHTVTISGTGWAGAPQGLTVTACHGVAGGDPEDLPASLEGLRQACATLADDSGRGNPAGDGTWSYNLAVNVTQQDIDNESIAILAGQPQEGSQWTAIDSLGVGDQREETATAANGGSVADTGVDSGLIVIIVVSVLVAGLLAVALGRRFAKRA